MKKIYIGFLFCFFFVVNGFAQERYKVVFYNLENFFDTINDPEVLDDEFTPEGSKKWNNEKYAIKLSNVERVLFDIASIDKKYPAIIGVCEVENRNVLEDIVATKKMSPANYRIVHYDSPERRGVDVAFLYRPDIFKKQGEKAVKVTLPDEPYFRTRDILTMWGTIEEEPFFFMVAHWPSRLGGKADSEYRRIAVAKQMRSIADSVRAENPAVKVILMGDFNDDPTDYSMTDGLKSKTRVKDVKQGDLFSPFADVLKAGYGTLAYQDAWNIFDNIVISDNLLSGGSNNIKIRKAKRYKYYGNIFSRHYMLQKSGQYKGYPLRTFVGDNFQGGYSDHFPVYIYIGK